MVKAVVSDFSYVLLFAKDTSYTGKLNDLNDKLISSVENYEPLDYFRVNTELIANLQQYKDIYTFYIFTAGKMHKLPSLQKELSIVFSHYLSEADIGLPKNNPEAFNKLAEMIGLPKEEILFIDDKLENVQAAKQAGLQAVQYNNNQQLIEELAKIL